MDEAEFTLILAALERAANDIRYQAAFEAEDDAAELLKAAGRYEDLAESLDWWHETLVTGEWPDPSIHAGDDE